MTPLQIKCRQKGRYPTTEAERRTVAVQMDVDDGMQWFVGRIPSGAYSVSTGLTKVVFGRNDEPNISFADHIELGALCFLDSRKGEDPAADVPRVQRHRSATFDPEQLLPNVPSVYELDEQLHHVGPICKHVSSLLMVHKMLQRLPNARCALVGGGVQS